MRNQTFPGRWAIASALFLAFCSRGNSPSLTTPSNASAPPATVDGGVVGASAVGDVQNGPIEINLVRVAQTDGVPAFYASADGVYVVRPEREIEIYIQIWTSSPTVDRPRLIVEWGDGERDNIHCGPCRLSRTYRTEGVYRVTVTMDDRVGGRTRRTFTLDVRKPSTGACTIVSSFIGNLNGVSTNSTFETGTVVALPSQGWTNVLDTGLVYDGAGGNGALVHTISGPYANYQVQHDTAVALQPSTTYTLHFDMGYLAGLTGGNSGYSFQLGALNGGIFTGLGSAVTGNAPYAGNLTAGSVSAQTNQVFVTGGSVPIGSLAVRWAQTSSLGGGTSDFFGFDNVTLLATRCVAVP